MMLAQLSAWQLCLLALPILPNLWCIWHAAKHEFPGATEKYLWIFGSVFLPIIGGLLYLLFGFRRSKPAPQPLT